RLRLAAEPQTGRREVSALTDARKTLAYDFFRILRAPRLALSIPESSVYNNSSYFRLPAPENAVLFFWRSSRKILEA
ncbi:hypothetical protein, partial [Escherichia coli]